MAERRKILPIPPEILKAIGEKSATVRLAAEMLSTTVETLCAKMARIPGRVETTYYGKHPDNHPDSHLELGLMFHKDAGKWVVSWCDWDNETAAQHDDYTATWKPLTEAPYKIKVGAIRLMPHLLAAMEKSQDKLIEEYTEAAREATVLIEEIENAKKEANK